MPPDTVKVDRSTPFGNPFSADDLEPAKAVALFRAWICGKISPAELSSSLPHNAVHFLLIARRRLLGGLPSLRGKNLACWCPLPREGEPDMCHAATLLELANRETAKSQKETQPQAVPDGPDLG